MLRPLSVALACLAALIAPVAAADDRGRWPLWPTEVERVAEPMRAGPEGEIKLVPETRRVAALRALERYATPLVAPILVEALSDRSGNVRREALQACLERALLACVPAARQIWQTELSDPGLRIAALRVIAQDPDPGRTPLLLGALRDGEESVRAEAARTVAAAHWPADQRATVRSSLIAKLADPSPVVRRAAAHGLGLLGPGDGALALTRLLADPDPQVRQDTAEALARLRDARAAPALLRTLQAGDETYVSRSLLAAFAALPGPDVDAELLRMLDAPPRGLTHRYVAEAIARRPSPGPALAEGLVARLREEILHAAVLDALLGLGDAARPALRAALERGLEPPLELEVRRLLAALDPPSAPARLDPAWPRADDPAAWRALLEHPDLALRLRAASTLGERAPAWLPRAAAGALAELGTDALRRPWLLALAAAPPHDVDDPPTAARLAAWAEDPRQASADRCLALAALSTARAHRPQFERTLERLLASDSPAMRACGASATVHLPQRIAEPLLLASLHDDAARVRAAAALALACRAGGAPEPARPLLALLAARDPEPAVVRATTFATVAGERCERWGLLLAPEGANGAWIDLRWRDRSVAAPSENLGPTSIAFAPGLDEATPVRVEAPVPEVQPGPQFTFD